MADDDGDVPPNATVYVRNINERVKIPALTEALQELFSGFGEVVDIVAKKSLKRKGQAFVIYNNIDSAQEAIDEVQGFELFGQQLHLEFAKSRSDATVKREDGDDALETHKRHRLAEKERKQAVEAAQPQPAKRAAAADTLTERPAKASKAAPATNQVVPDEYLPPSKTLFLRELPDDYGKDALAAIFNRFPGFKEVRTVPGRNNLAFVEYEDEEGAIAAKENTAGVTLGDKPIRITFRRQ